MWPFIGLLVAVWVMMSLIFCEYWFPIYRGWWNNLTADAAQRAINKAHEAREVRFRTQVAKLIEMGMSKETALEVVRAEFKKESDEMAKNYAETK